MSDRIQYGQAADITSDLLNESFAALERADRNLAADIGLSGIVAGFEVQPQSHPNLSVHLSGPGLAYDSQGRRVFSPLSQTVDCRRDVNGVRTDVLKAGHEVWLSIAVAFARNSEDITPAAGHKVGAALQLESFTIRVRRGEEAPLGRAEKPLPEPSSVTVCHAKLVHGTAAITANAIDLSQRDNLTLWKASGITVRGEDWQKLPPHARLEDVLAAIDADLNQLGNAYRSLVAPSAWKAIRPARSVQEALDNTDEALGRLDAKMQQLVRPNNWQALPPSNALQNVVDAIDSLISRQVLATRSIADSIGQISARLDSLQCKTRPRAHRVHECIYYTREVDVPAMGPRDTRIMAVHLEDVQASDVPGFARPANAETARQLHVQIVAAMNGFVRLAFTNLTSHYLYPGVQTYEFGLWVLDVK